MGGRVGGCVMKGKDEGEGGGEGGSGIRRYW